MVTVVDNLRRLWEKIEIAAAQTGRNSRDICLVAVTKQVPLLLVEQAIAAGVADFGENKMQEARSKISTLTSPARWHMIGHLQTNKAREAVGVFDLIQSVDSVRLAEEINRQAARIGKSQEILVQVNTSAEPQKSGCRAEDMDQLVEKVCDMPAIRLRGLMTIGPLTEDRGRISASFRRLKAEFDRLAQTPWGRDSMKYLSMGMSGDFEVALAEGANMLRIGTAIFGPRA